jgi:tRNA pseudouridine13 synthase
MMIGHLKDNPGDYLGALRTLPYNLLMMFVHAYQSYLFNRTLSERIRRGMSIKEPEVGDLILPLSKNNVPDHDNPILVTEDNLGKAVRNAREGKAFVSGLIYGTESVFAQGRMGEIEMRIIESESLKPQDFQIVGLREASSKGTRRELYSPYKELSIMTGEGEATFGFTLNKGCYATALLREFMKADISQY